MTLLGQLLAIQFAILFRQGRSILSLFLICTTILSTYSSISHNQKCIYPNIGAHVNQTTISWSLNAAANAHYLQQVRWSCQGVRGEEWRGKGRGQVGKDLPARVVTGYGREIEGWGCGQGGGEFPGGLPFAWWSISGWRMRNRVVGSDNPILQGVYTGESHGATSMISHLPVDALCDFDFQYNDRLWKQGLSVLLTFVNWSMVPCHWNALAAWTQKQYMIVSR